MALETLRNVTKISGVKIQRENEDNFDRNFILLKEKESIIAFKIQDGPIKEVGENGVQFTSLIEVAKLILEELNKKFPCRENIYRDWETDRKSTRLNSSHRSLSRMPSSA